MNTAASDTPTATWDAKTSEARTALIRLLLDLHRYRELRLSGSGSSIAAMTHVGAGFGYKIAWVAVRDRPHGDIADALGFDLAGQADWPIAVDHAYSGGWLITPAVGGWRLAASTSSTCADDDIPRWVAEISRALGEVQYFGTHRVVEFHAWIHAAHGTVVRGFAYVGDQGRVLCNTGRPSPIEKELRVSGWRRRIPHEQDVMTIAGAWSVDPQSFENARIDDLPWIGRHR